MITPEEFKARMEDNYYSKLRDELYDELYDKLYDELFYDIRCGDPYERLHEERTAENTRAKRLEEEQDCLETRCKNDEKEEQIKNKQDCKSLDADMEQTMSCFPCESFGKVFEWCTRNWRSVCILPKRNETVHVYVNNGEYATVCCGFVNDLGKWTLDCDSTFCPRDIKKWEYASEWQLESTENPTVAIFKIKNDPMYGRKNHISFR